MPEPIAPPTGQIRPLARCMFPTSPRWCAQIQHSDECFLVTGVRYTSATNKRYHTAYGARMAAWRATGGNPKGMRNGS